MMMLFVVLKTLQPQLDESLRLTCSLAGEIAKASLAQSLDRTSSLVHEV